MSIRPVVPWVLDVSTMSIVRMTQPLIEAGSITITGVMEVTGPLTDTELRAADVKVTLDGEQITIANLPETQPVSGNVGVNNFPATQPVSLVSVPTHAVTGPQTDAEARASAQPVSDATFEVLLRQLIAAFNCPVWYNPAINGLIVGGAVTVSSGTVTTVTTVSGLTNIGGVGAAAVPHDLSAGAWGESIRSLLT